MCEQRYIIYFLIGLASDLYNTGNNSALFPDSHFLSIKAARALQQDLCLPMLFCIGLSFIKVSDTAVTTNDLNSQVREHPTGAESRICSKQEPSYTGSYTDSPYPSLKHAFFLKKYCSTKLTR